MISLRLAVSSLILLGAVAARADDTIPGKDEEAVQREIARLDMVKPRESIRPLNNVSFSYELGLNMRATFKGFGTAANTFTGSNPGSTAHPTDHEYDDGYNRVDSTGNNHAAQGFPNTTTFWGYQNDSQWNHANNTIEMHSSHPTQFGDVSNDDPRHGFQLSYERLIGECKHFYWGIEANFGYTLIDFNENRTLIAPVLTTTDTYAIPFDEVIGTNSVPAAPYHGPANGNLGTSLLSDTPTRSVTPSGEVSTLMATRHFDANVWRLHFGPKLHVPVNNRLELTFAGGLAVGVVDSHFNFSEQVVFSESLGGITQPFQQGSSTTLGALVGPYFNGMVEVPLRPNSRLFAGLQWDDLGNYHQSIGTHVAQLNLSDALSVSMGFGVSF